jgi:tetratricopeptide (TPR) repeat protein
MRVAPLVAASVAVGALAGLWAYQTADRIPAYEDLQTFWETTVRDNPGAGFPHAGLATVYADAGRIDDAEEQYRLAVAGVMTDEQRALAWSNLGALLSQNGDYDGAVEAHTEAIAVAPDSSQIHYNVAVAHWRQATASDPPDPSVLALALDEARTAVDLDADDPLRLAFLATVAFESGDFDLARDTYRQVLRIEHTGRWADLARRELSRPELQ